MKHLCIVCCQHPPDDVRVTHKIGMAFRAAGYRVSWVGPERPCKGETYGLDFHYYPLRPGKLGRLARFRDAFATAARVDGVDAFYAPEPDSAFVAAALGRMRGVPSVFDIHEVYHGEMLHRWARGPARQAASEAVRWGMLAICSQVDLVVAVSDVVMEPYSRVRTDKLIVRNCAPVSFADGGAAELFPSGRAIRVMHGKTTLSHGTKTVVEALGRVRARGHQLTGVFFDTFATQADGFQRDDFLGLARTIGLPIEAIDLRSLIPMLEMAKVLRTCDVGIIAYDRTWGRNSLPNKLFEYMGAGLPIIAPSYAVEVAKIVETEGCGLLVDTEDAAALADALADLASRPDAARAMGQRGRAAFLARHNWQSEVAPLVDFVSGTSRWSKSG